MNFLFSYYNLSMYDVCYVVKDTPDNEELRYSLRSLQNLPNVRNVWIYGGKPEFLVGKYHKKSVVQDGSKWDNSGKIFWEIINDEDITEDFYLMMDDVFVMQPIHEFVNFSRTSMATQRHSTYYDAKRDAMNWLKNHHKPTRDFDSHRPFLYNRQKVKELFPLYPYQTCFRSVYGNWYEIPTESHKDCKVFSVGKYLPPSDDYCLSTTDKSFRKGQVGVMIRKCFPVPSIYEK